MTPHIVPFSRPESAYRRYDVEEYLRLKLRNGRDMVLYVYVSIERGKKKAPLVFLPFPSIFERRSLLAVALLQMRVTRSVFGGDGFGLKGVSRSVHG